MSGMKAMSRWIDPRRLYGDILSIVKFSQAFFVCLTKCRGSDLNFRREQTLASRERKKNKSNFYYERKGE